MLTRMRAVELLEPFGLDLSSAQVERMLAYIELLLRWNRKINLTAIRSPEECVTRHFGESLYLARWVELRGRLLDIGSGAGFPGLALKIAAPDLSVTLLEPAVKKRAFLKEVVRVCGMERVEVRPERLEEFEAAVEFDIATSRAVGHLSRLVPQASRLLVFGGELCVWTTRDQIRDLAQVDRNIDWRPPVALPLARDRQIWVGTPKVLAGGRS
jgi:16S rRNA (guanine527-N7)-methyltransferase